MSSYNLITKIKYTGNASDLVSLNEYIVFQDDKAKRKYIVFKFVNNVTQQLLGMEFEVCQYNVDGNLIEKSVVAYNKFLAGAEEEFVPKAKLRVSYNCKTISVRLISAAFDRFVWKEGEFEDNCYKFDHFYRDEQELGGAAGAAGAAGARPAREGRAGRKRGEKPEKQPKRKKEKKNKHPFVMRDATKKNFARFPKVFNVIIIILVLALTVGSVLWLKYKGKQFTVGDYLVRVIDGDKVAVYGYIGDETEIVIEEKIGDYTVTKIDGGAFRRSEITTVTINCQLTIETDAFVDCTDLRTVRSEYAVTVLEGAFRNCGTAVRLNMPNAFIYDNAIING